MSFNRLNNANIEETSKAKITDILARNPDLQQRVFYFGQVINNIDKGNLNRIQVRIPILDDSYYLENKKTGDKRLPWASSMSTRFIDTPENNSIVLVAVFDIRTPYFGRIYFNSLTDIGTIELFKKLSPEEKLLSNIKLVEDIFQIKTHQTPINQHEFDGDPNINYNLGIRGKGGNSVLLSEKSIQLKQNIGNEFSDITLTKDIDINSIDEINLISKKGNNDHYKPIFNTPLYEYLSSVNGLIKKIIQVLVTQPAMSPAGPCTASPAGEQLVEGLIELTTKYQEYTKKGHSKKININ